MIRTFSGIWIDPTDLHPSQVRIDDIATSLAHQGRWMGHTGAFLSVASHSVLVSEWCDPRDALAGLLHDGSEAYLVDVPTPIKVLPEFAAYRDLEARAQAAVYAAFGLPPGVPESVKRADRAVLEFENRSLRSSPRVYAGDHPDWQPAAAREQFLERYRRIVG